MFRESHLPLQATPNQAQDDLPWAQKRPQFEELEDARKSVYLSIAFETNDELPAQCFPFVSFGPRNQPFASQPPCGWQAEPTQHLCCFSFHAEMLCHLSASILLRAAHDFRIASGLLNLVKEELVEHIAQLFFARLCPVSPFLNARNESVDFLRSYG